MINLKNYRTSSSNYCCELMISLLHFLDKLSDKHRSYASCIPQKESVAMKPECLTENCKPLRTNL